MPAVHCVEPSKNMVTDFRTCVLSTKRVFRTVTIRWGRVTAVGVGEGWGPNVHLAHARMCVCVCVCVFVCVRACMDGHVSRALLNSFVFTFNSILIRRWR